MAAAQPQPLLPQQQAAVPPIAAPQLSTALQDKLYRQALYYYFAGDFNGALRQLSLNQQRYGAGNSKTQLFAAGLQVNLGLHQQASDTLIALSHARPTDSQANVRTNPASAQLTLIALLQLAEQQLQQGQAPLAQQALAQITAVTPAYRNQYLILNQLAYWPQPAPPQALVPLQPQSLSQISLERAYLLLNRALRHLQQQQYQQAEPLLLAVKNNRWPQQQRPFWQQLFLPWQPPAAHSDDQQQQQQAASDQARLLLGQLYLHQQQFAQAQQQLQQFPEHSPFAQQGLFMLAHATAQNGDAQLAQSLFGATASRYPQSQLGWQAALLQADSLAQQQQLDAAAGGYQQAQQHYRQQQQQLQQFSQAIDASADLLQLAPSLNNDQHSQWLQQALQHPNLAAKFAGLTELKQLHTMVQQQQQQSDWLGQGLTLNQQRRHTLTQQQQANPTAPQLAQLQQQISEIEQLIATAAQHQDGQRFANQQQQQWLQRLNRSQQNIDMISNQRNTHEYQQRLQRLKGVLHWQLQSQLPQRLWQHRRLLQGVHQQLAQAQSQQQTLSGLMQKQPQLAKLQQRHRVNANQIAGLNVNIRQQQQQLTVAIRHQLQQFIAQQQQLLTQYTLQARHGLARTLEQMAAAAPNQQSSATSQGTRQ
ncbi:hypothetical protein [uncultured Ferrimonas sp.]|uniref:hypothetical protein n=1 Tax=uncultured Ferrimonas sp. TaxID=432640 RepID=UPI002616FE3A|nr:hypothetical protein [uncultured Ferrimonas sp.]